jgi:hypothetical protein
MGDEEDKAACHSDLTDSEQAISLQEENLAAEEITDAKPVINEEAALVP